MVRSYQLKWGGQKLELKSAVSRLLEVSEV